MICRICVLWCSNLIVFIRSDDPVNAVAVHGYCGTITHAFSVARALVPNRRVLYHPAPPVAPRRLGVRHSVL